MVDSYRGGLTTPELPNATRLVPFERYLSAIRWQFARGVLVGIVASATFLIPAFKYSNIRHRGASSQQGLGQSVAGSSDAQDAGARKSTSEMSGTSLAPSIPRKPVSSESPSHFADALAKPAAARNLAKSPTPGSVNQPATLRESASTEPKLTKKSLATLAQLWASVEAGDSKAAVALADVYLRGDGVPVNCEQARVLLFVASKENNAEATRKLQDLDESSCPQP